MNSPAKLLVSAKDDISRPATGGDVKSTAEALDLSSCDREPIHQLGAIQPIGFLIAVSSDFRIVRVSDNVDRYVGRPASDLLGLPLADIFAREAIHALRNCLVHLYGTDAVERVFGLALLVEGDGRRFDCAVHESTGVIVIEAEPSNPMEATEAAGLVRSMIARLDAAPNLARFLQQGARQIHGLTGFDRVMVYRFRSDGSGEVVAEVARSGIEPLLGLRYPASDIPQQARALYLRTPFRIIGDVDAAPATILSSPDDPAGPLDLSLSVLRAVSPIHIVYLKNMGVAASLSVSIIAEGRLWGLFACHHYTPRCPAFDLRTLAELFGQMFSMRLESRERQAAAATQATTRAAGDRLVAAVARDVGLLDDPDWLMTAIGDILPCDGVAITLKGRIACGGVSPPADALPAMAARLGVLAPGRIFATDHLADAMPEAVAGPDAPAGMLAIPLSAEPNDYVMLFRRQCVQLVTWAGNPNKPVDPDAPGATLSPRASFAAWREEVRDRSEPFTQAEQAIAETLRVSLIEVVLRLAGAALAERQRAGQRQEVLIAELNHRVRNILALINGLIRQSSDPSIPHGAYIDLLEGRILSLARAHDQITQDNWGPAPIRQLFEAEGAHYIGAERMTLSGPPVLVEPLAFSTLSLVVHELVTNSVKYGALSGDGRVEIDWTVDPAGDLVLTWGERDGPPVAAPARQGLGTTIIEQSVPHELGGVAAMSHEPTGLRARFEIPSRHFRAAYPAVPGMKESPEPPVAGASPDLAAIDAPVLLVEDSLLVAIHVEDILTQIGATRVVTAATVAAALKEIDGVRPAVAVLDFNLGDEDSLPVADRLRAAGIPYIFATGYGDKLTLPPDHAGTRILRKPYNKATLAATLGQVLRADPPAAAPAADDG